MLKIVFTIFIILALTTFFCVGAVVAGIYTIMATAMEQFMVTAGIQSGRYAAGEAKSGENPMTSAAIQRPSDGWMAYDTLSDIYTHHMQRTAQAVYDWVSDDIDAEKYAVPSTIETQHGNAVGKGESVVLIRVCDDQSCQERDMDISDMGLTYDDLLLLEFILSDGDERWDGQPDISVDGRRDSLGASQYLGDIMINGKTLAGHKPSKFAERLIQLAQGLNFDGIDRKYETMKYGRLTSGFGWRTFYHSRYPNGIRHFHAAIDRSAPLNSPVYARFDGKVVDVGYHVALGGYVAISNGEMIYITGHLDVRGLNIKPGDYVRGPRNGSDNGATMIGRIAMNGITTGPHRHDEVLVTVNGTWYHVNPCEVIDHCSSR